jgi:hypothetical protein
VQLGNEEKVARALSQRSGNFAYSGSLFAKHALFLKGVWGKLLFPGKEVFPRKKSPRSQVAPGNAEKLSPNPFKNKAEAFPGWIVVGLDLPQGRVGETVGVGGGI